MFEVIPINGQTWLICGGRDFTDQETFDSAMHELTRRQGCPSRVVHGGARGADQMAGKWAAAKAIDCAVERADWKAHRRAAGPIRNQAMLDRYKPFFVVAFPGGRGTADMVRRAKAADVNVAEIQQRSHAGEG